LLFFAVVASLFLAVMVPLVFRPHCVLLTSSDDDWLRKRGEKVKKKM
jgi:hypothetical protein